MNLTRNFTEKELACPCCGECPIDEVLLTKLQAYRDIVSIPLIIASAYRCHEHNRSVGGSLNSQHLKGKAIDIRINDKDAITRYRMIKAAFDPRSIHRRAIRLKLVSTQTVSCI